MCIKDRNNGYCLCSSSWLILLYIIFIMVFINEHGFQARTAYKKITDVHKSAIKKSFLIKLRVFYAACVSSLILK